ncbi:MAG: hypothetical protein ACAI34_03230 [Verrucomicrobium sp.]|nr:hypothetical protein [Verrucomicrobium sp.]
MARLVPESFQPRLGLASIEISNEEIAPLLPEDSRLQPIDASVEAQLEAILHAQTFERVMLDAIRPSVEDQSMLRPGVFHQMREEITGALQAALAGNTDPAAREELQAVIRLLQELGADHALGEQYRYALLKG